MLLTTIQQFHFYLSTVYRESASYYSREGGSPFQGGCQGNGTAPALLVKKNRIIIMLMNQQLNDEELSTSCSMILIYILALMFIEYT